jgi:hypothetical protein
MNIPTRDEIRAAYRQGEEAIIQLFERLIQELQAQQDRLNKNSKNSSKPPSSDVFKKSCTKSTTKKGSKKSGGQKGRMCSVVFVGISLQRGRTGVLSSMLFTMRLESLHLFLQSVLSH